MSGWFGLLGSGEFERWSVAVDEWLLTRATGDGLVLVLPTASAPEGDSTFDDWADRGSSHYARAGIPAEVLPVHDRVDAQDAVYSTMVERASMVFFSGGNPAYLARTLTGTSLWSAILQGLDRGMAYAGCSAGMACLGRTAPDSTVNELSGQMWQSGLGLFPRAWLGPHWDMLDRYAPGLVDHVVSSVPRGEFLVGVDENTAIVGDGRAWDVIGQGRVHIYEGSVSASHADGSAFRCDLLT